MTYRRRSSTPDICLPPVHNRDWKFLSKILCIDESLNDSGAAFFINGTYQPKPNGEGIDIGFVLTQPKNATTVSKIIKYKSWVKSLLDECQPDLVIGESHPFARGNHKTSIVTLEVMAGVRYITMLACGKQAVPYVEFSTNHVKTIMCGGASATKEMVQLVLTGCGYTLPKYANGAVNGNVCDAIAMGEVICRMQKQELLRREYIQDVGEGRSQTRSRRMGRKTSSSEDPQSRAK